MGVFRPHRLSFLIVLWVDERFWINPADHHWKHIDPVRRLLPIHGLAGLTALVAGALQMSSRIGAAHCPASRGSARSTSLRSASRPQSPSNRTSTLEPATMRVEQIFQAGLWLVSALVAWACIRSGQMALHKAWMMRSYAFTLIFVLSRVPDAWIAPTATRGLPISCGR